MTWLFVRMFPSAVKTTPEPVPCAIGVSWFLPKNLRTWSAFSSRAVTSICTTAGPTRSATDTKPSDSLRASTWAAAACGEGTGGLSCAAADEARVASTSAKQEPSRRMPRGRYHRRNRRAVLLDPRQAKRSTMRDHGRAPFVIAPSWMSPVPGASRSVSSSVAAPRRYASRRPRRTSGTRSRPRIERGVDREAAEETTTRRDRTAGRATSR